MAPIIKLPVKFEFMASRGRWKPAVARVVGWWETEGGRADDEQHLKAEILGDPEVRREFRMDLGNLPEPLWDRCVTASPEDDVAAICDQWTPLVLVNTMKDAPTRAADAWSMRQEFLKMAPTVERVVPFLNKWGRWRGGIQFLDAIVRLHREFRRALTESPQRWLAHAVARLPRITHAAEYPYFLMSTGECELAIRATITLDLLNEVLFAICARPDCRAPYAITSEHQRQYCDQYCAHLESQRRNRKARAENKNAGAHRRL